MPGKKIMVVDDHRDGGESLQHLLQAWGHDAQLALDGAQAVELAETFRPDVVVMDINMPILDGYAASRLLRVAHKEILMIAMTGSPAHETSAKAQAAGFHHHFAKPIDLVDLQRLLDDETLTHLKPGFVFGA